MAERRGVRLRIFLFFAGIASGAAAIIGLAMWAALVRIGPDALPHLVLTGGGAALAIAVLTLWVWQKCDEQVARPIRALSHMLEAHSAGDAALEPIGVGAEGPLAPLASAAERVCKALGSARQADEARLADATKASRAETGRLEVVLRDLSEAVVVCNRENRILLYNHEAVRLLDIEGETGLGRSLFALVVEQPVRHALDRLGARVAENARLDHPEELCVNVVTATCSGGRTLEGRLRLLTDLDGLPAEGFMVTFKDSTAAIAAQAAREHLIADSLRELRRHGAAIGLLTDLFARETTQEEAARLLSAQRVAVDRMIAAIRSGTARLHEFRKAHWLMADVYSSTLFACVRGRLSRARAAATAIEGDPCWLHCDSFTVVELLVHLIERLAAERRTVTLSAVAGDAHVHVDLNWRGAPLALSTLEEWLDEPVERCLGHLTGRDVLIRHQSELWPEAAPDGLSRLRLALLPQIADHRHGKVRELRHRPEFYDFGLIDTPQHAELADLPLRSAVYVVFDTETTGLNPGQGDQIVQIAGVRIVNGRLMRGETFDELVNPGRPIPPSATRVHRITDAMVADAPAAETVLRRFHAFAHEAILVAHNAPFDMKFLHMKETGAGLRFDQPVLDTVLLSAFLFGQDTDHTLDALAARFGVTLPDEARHTALGDTLATAQVFMRLLELLDARGMRTLGDAERISARMHAIRRKQSAY